MLLHLSRWFPALVTPVHPAGFPMGAWRPPPCCSGGEGRLHLGVLRLQEPASGGAPAHPLRPRTGWVGGGTGLLRGPPLPLARLQPVSKGRDCWAAGLLLSRARPDDAGCCPAMQTTPSGAPCTRRLSLTAATLACLRTPSTWWAWGAGVEWGHGRNVYATPGEMMVVLVVGGGGVGWGGCAVWDGGGRLVQAVSRGRSHGGSPAGERSNASRRQASAWGSVAPPCDGLLGSSCCCRPAPPPPQAHIHYLHGDSFGNSVGWARLHCAATVSAPCLHQGMAACRG